VRLSTQVAVALGTLCLFTPGADAASPSPADLGAAASFGVFAATTVTNTGATVVNGDLGVSPGTAVTGFGAPPAVNGTVWTGADAKAAQAHADIVAAYADVADRPDATPVAGALGGLTWAPGAYSSAALDITGKATLDAGGDPGAVFIFQSGSTLISAADSQVELVHGAQACNVFWQVGSSATLGASSFLRGTILTKTSITVGSDVTLDGRALARDGAVTMDTDTVTTPECAGTLLETAPSIAPFETTLTGVTRTVHTAVGAWSVTDATGSGSGYSVTVTATPPTVNGSEARAGTGGSLTLTPRTAIAAAGNPAQTGPVARSPQVLDATAATIQHAAPGTGQGEWTFAPDAGNEASLAVRIPGDAGAGVYASTLTFTTAAPAG
jgi:hypothetical protein